MALLPSENLLKFGCSFAFVETSIQQDSVSVGFVTDVQKAFEHLPRAPVLQLAAQLGISSKILGLWNYFLQHTQRRFVLGNGIGDPISSNSGLQSTKVRGFPVPFLASELQRSV